MEFSGNEFEIEIDQEQPYTLQLVDTATKNVVRFTMEEALTMLTLMIKYRDELQLLKRGQ